MKKSESGVFAWSERWPDGWMDGGYHFHISHSKHICGCSKEYLLSQRDSLVEI